MSLFTNASESFFRSIGSFFGYGVTNEPVITSTTSYGRPLGESNSEIESLKGYRQESPYDEIEKRLGISSSFSREEIPNTDEERTSWLGVRSVFDFIFSSNNLMGRVVNFVLGDSFKSSAVNDLSQAADIVKKDGVRGLSDPNLEWSWPTEQRRRVQETTPIRNYIREKLTEIRDDATTRAREITRR